MEKHSIRLATDMEFINLVREVLGFDPILPGAAGAKHWRSKKNKKRLVALRAA